MNKFKFTHDRYLKLHEECINRDFNVNNYSNNWLNIEKPFYETYKPTEEEKKLLLNRISERIIGSKKQYFHKIGAGNPTIPKGGWEECDCHALNCLTKLVIIF